MNNKVSILNMQTAPASDATSQVADYFGDVGSRPLVEGVPTT
jgi:hypothetical protein